MKFIETREELEDLKSRGEVEGEQLDFKRQLPSANEALAKTMCAFANASGGLIILGAKYDDKTRVLSDFPGISEIPDIESKIEQIALNIRPRISARVSKRIQLQDEGKYVYTIWVDVGQLQPHQSSYDGRYWCRCGSQSAHLPENIIEQMYLARQNAGNQVRGLLEKHHYGIPPNYIKTISNYWLSFICIPLYPRKEMFLNSEKLLKFLEGEVKALLPGGSSFRNTHFGYRLTVPSQNYGEGPVPDLTRRVEVHHDGVLIFGKKMEFGGDRHFPGTKVVKEFDKSRESFKLIYDFANYGGFCHMSVVLQDIKNAKIFFGQNEDRNEGRYPFESDQLKIDLQLSVLDLKLENLGQSFKDSLFQAFGGLF